MDLRPIGVFDSGLGGLTGVKALLELLPGEDIVYFGDTGRVPYGGRSRQTIVRYARQAVSLLLRHDVKAILVACGTVSTNALEDIKGDYPIPITGVVEAAAAAAAKATKNGRIGLIGTKATVRSSAFEQRIRAELPGAQVFKNACPLFVPLVEEGRTDPSDKVLQLVVEDYLAPIKAAGVDTLILGCTHYPLIFDAIARSMGPGVTLINTAEAAAADMAELLKNAGLLSGGGSGSLRCFVSDSTEGFAQSAAAFLGRDVGDTAQQISVDEL